MIAFEIVRWVLITGFAVLGISMFKMVLRSLEDADRNAALRVGGGWIILTLCCSLAVVTFHVQP